MANAIRLDGLGLDHCVPDLHDGMVASVDRSSRFVTLRLDGSLHLADPVAIELKTVS